MKSGKARLHTREVATSLNIAGKLFQRQQLKTSRSPNQERRKRPSSADAVRRRPFSVMSFEPRVETRSLEASYNLTAQLRLEMMERRREEEVRGKTKYEIISPLKVRAKGRKEKEEKEKEERGRRRRLNNPVWENIKAEIEVFSSSKIFSFFLKYFLKANNSAMYYK